ncbi:mediator of RNA polymerase II transcription subunit 1 [Megalops cyprinoides]|uniref:mediator of RNA polymerase II transcription subunit 1 n=1 Tax=Megalops cyprinoides TaxID=118141 RepID=UPI00186450E1|nr:mediator of RNA polymerase II transcription subunit 1 [Megalops cyprinoides]
METIAAYKRQHFHCGDVRDNILVTELRSKFAERTWNETSQLVRRCMDKPKSDSTSNQLFLGCLERLHEALNVSSSAAMVSRLETIAKRRGLGSHLSPTETTCYLTSDMFYLEVMLLPGGGVEDVKVAHHGEAPASSKPLLKLLRSKQFEDFSMKLGCLSALYNIPGDNETKVKVYAALQHLEKDLMKISQLPRPLIHSNPHVDVILNGRIGKATPRKEGHPLSLEYYISPYDLLAENPSTGIVWSSGRVALVTAGASDSTHRLQRTSLIPKPPQINLQGLPVFSPMDEVTSEVLPACFFLKPQPPLPMLSSFIHKMHLITETAMCEADLQWLPFPELLMGTSLRESVCNASWEGDNAHFLVPLPDNQMHCYVLSWDSWGIAALKGALVHSIPFTHPIHVPMLLELLRHQTVFNTLLASCISPHQPHPGSESSLHCEVRAESESSFSVSFPLPDSSCLGVHSSMDDYISRVLKRCMSVPLTMRVICRRLAKREAMLSSAAAAPTVAAGNNDTPAALSCNEASECDGPVVELESAHHGPPSAVTSQNAAAAAADPSSVPMSPVCSYYVMSVPPAESDADANTEPRSNPYPGTLAGVFPSWSTSNPLSI